MIWIILAFGAHFIGCWIRIWIQEANLMRIHADPDTDTDPDPKHWMKVYGTGSSGGAIARTKYERPMLECSNLSCDVGGSGFLIFLTQKVGTG